MKKEWIVPDTEHTKRMKEYAVSDVYSNGSDLCKLLSIKGMHSLVEKIKKGNIDASKLVFGRETITLEERFLENVDRYITYIRDNFYFSSTEQLLTIEESLSNKYAKILKKTTNKKTIVITKLNLLFITLLLILLNIFYSWN